MMKEKDKGVKINDDLRKKLGKKWNALSKVEKENFMAKSKESSKQYSLQKGVVPKLYLQTRCSPERVIRVIEKLEPKQKAAIEEIGFDIDSIKKMNWAEFVLSYLVHGIEEFKKKQQSGVCGCLLFLMVINLHHSEIRFCFNIIYELTIYLCQIYL
ncbi:uncharacterized protein LOC104877818 isoform X2 [Vitis vinifera]|uniref:uncharacterized protein LOC104877818 isoform X2 n=1 Tax=Vitis vinifera TaxID=29760 RepID=UPI002882F965|nr:uncharacterized protein LOC104877818 isoform X2 [Vitis vinifera]